MDGVLLGLLLNFVIERKFCFLIIKKGLFLILFCFAFDIRNCRLYFGYVVFSICEQFGIMVVVVKPPPVFRLGVLNALQFAYCLIMFFLLVVVERRERDDVTKNRKY